MSKQVLALTLALMLILVGCKSNEQPESQEGDPINNGVVEIEQSPYREDVPDWDMNVQLPEFETAYSIDYLLEGKQVYDKFVRLPAAQRIVHTEEKGRTTLYIPYSTIPIGYIVNIPIIIDGVHTSINVWRYKEGATYITLDLCSRMGDFSKNSEDIVHYPVEETDAGMKFRCIDDDKELIWSNKAIYDDNNIRQLQWYPLEESVIMDYCRPISLDLGEFAKYSIEYADVPWACYPWIMSGTNLDDWNGIPCVSPSSLSNSDIVAIDYEVLSYRVWYVYNSQEYLVTQIENAISEHMPSEVNPGT